MDGFSIDVDFLINNPRLKADADKAKADITGVGITAESIQKRVAEAVQRSANAQDAYSQELAKAKQMLNQVGIAQKELNLRLKEGQINAETFSKASGLLIQKELELKNAIQQTTNALKVQGQAAVQRMNNQGLNMSVNQITRELPAFAVSPQIGILALSNNIPILADQIVNLKKQNELLVASGQKGIPVWKSITSALFGWQTILSLSITFLTIYGREVGEFFKKLFAGSKAIDEVKASQEALNKALESSDYNDAVKNVLSLEANIDLAKRGMIDAKGVVDQYNETLGKATGTVESLAEAEQMLIDNGDKYVQMMLYKAAANLALDDAAKVAYETLQERQKLEKDILKQEEAVRAAQQRFASGPGGNENVLRAQQQRLQEMMSSLQKLNSDSEKAIEDRNNLFLKLNQTAASFGLDTYLSKGKTGGGEDLLKGRQALLDRLAALDAEYARKRFDRDEEELLALRDKFARIRELVERFNADPKNKEIQIAIADVNAAQGEAEKNLLDLQAEKRKAKADEERRRELEALKQQWQTQLSGLMDYQAKRNDLIAKYEALKLNLLMDGREKELAIATDLRNKELQELDDAEVKKMAAYKELYEGIEHLSDSAARQVIENAREMLNALVAAGKISQEEYQKIIEKLGATEQALNDRLPQRLDQLAHAFADISHHIGESNEGLAMMLGLVSNILSASANIGANISGLKAGISNYQQNKADGGGGLLGGISAIAGIAGPAGQIISSITSLVSGIVRIAKMSRESAKQAAEEMARIQDRMMMGQVKMNQLQRERNIAAAEELDITLQMIEAKREALELSQRQTETDAERIFNELQSLSYIQTTAIQKKGGFLGIGRKSEVVNEYASLMGLTFEQIEKLYELGRLDGRAKELFEELRRLQEEGADIQQMLDELKAQAAEIWTGTTADSIGDGIIEGLRNGYTAVEDFAGDMEKLLQGAILNAIRYQALEEPLKELYAQFAADAESGGALTAEEIEKFKAAYNAIVQQAIDLYNQSADILDMPATGAGQGLQGAIRREMTEATASELTGLYRATFDVQKRQLIIAEQRFEIDRKCLDATMRIMASSAMTEENTRNTVVELKKAVAELVAINTNTKQNSTGYDRGF